MQIGPIPIPGPTVPSLTPGKRFPRYCALHHGNETNFETNAGDLIILKSCKVTKNHLKFGALHPGVITARVRMSDVNPVGESPFTFLRSKKLFVLSFISLKLGLKVGHQKAAKCPTNFHLRTALFPDMQ